VSSATGCEQSLHRATHKAINKEELSRHCRRRTRGAEETYKAIEDLLLQFTPATDSLGVPVFRYCILFVLTIPYVCRVTFANPLL